MGRYEVETIFIDSEAFVEKWSVSKMLYFRYILSSVMFSSFDNPAALDICLFTYRALSH